MISLVIRVGEDWPLYDILNQFKNGQSHMAVVLKCGENIRTVATHTESKTPGLVLHKYSHSKTNIIKKPSTAPIGSLSI